MRTLHEAPRGCGHRKDGGCYLMGEINELGNLPSCVEIDPPIPIDTHIIPFSRGVYMVNLDAVLTEDDQHRWLIDTSEESKDYRLAVEWDLERYGMTIRTRLRTGIGKHRKIEDIERFLSELQPMNGVYLADYILAITRAGRGRRVAREVSIMQKCKEARDWRGLLASCWRLTGYNGQGEEIVKNNIKRIMVSLGALEDAVEV